MTLFGTNISYVYKVFQAKFETADAGEIEDKIKLAESYSKVLMTMIVSIFILLVFSYALLHSKNPDIQKMSAGFIGTVIGYWLK